MEPTAPSPMIVLAICEITVGVPDSYGIAWILWANHETPRTKVPSNVLITYKVRRAFICSGVLKSATPSEIASSPVKDEPPFANARSKIKMAAKVSRPWLSPTSTAPGKSVGRTSSVPVATR